MRASVALGCWLVIAVVATWAQATAPQLVVLGRNVACRGRAGAAERWWCGWTWPTSTRLPASRVAGCRDRGGSTCFVSHRLVTPFDPAAPERAVVAIVESTARPGRRMGRHALFENRWQGIAGSAEMAARRCWQQTAGTIDYWQDPSFNWLRTLRLRPGSMRPRSSRRRIWAWPWGRSGRCTTSRS